MKSLNVVVLSALVFGCGEPKWAGNYTLDGTWDLGGPLAGGRTVGDSVADLVVEKLVEVAPIPSVFEETATKAVDLALRPHVKAVVDPRAPAEISPDGTVYQALAMSLAEVKVVSDLELKGSGKGTETFSTFEFSLQGTVYQLAGTELGTAGAPVVAQWNGAEVKGELFEVEPHVVEMHFGRLALRIVTQLLDLAGQTELKNQVLNAVACDQIVTRLSSGAGLTVSVVGWTHTFSDELLRSACDASAAALTDRALGLFKVDSAVEVGGKVSIAGAPAELLATEFGGLVGVAPRAIAPRLTTQFTAKRK